MTAVVLSLIGVVAWGVMLAFLLLLIGFVVAGVFERAAENMLS